MEHVVSPELLLLSWASCVSGLLTQKSEQQFGFNQNQPQSLPVCPSAGKRHRVRPLGTGQSDWLLTFSIEGPLLRLRGPEVSQAPGPVQASRVGLLGMSSVDLAPPKTAA